MSPQKEIQNLHGTLRLIYNRDLLKTKKLTYGRQNSFRAYILEKSKLFSEKYDYPEFQKLLSLIKIY